MDIASLQDEEARLIFQRFAEPEALRLGGMLVEMGVAGALPIAIDIRSQDRVLFHASLAGAKPLNDLWARRKGNTALIFQRSSMLVTLLLREKGQGLDRDGLSAADYVASGGAVPIRVRGVGVIGVVTVSGLPEMEDHALVVRAMEAMLDAG